jgi:hypothetical protein
MPNHTFPCPFCNKKMGVGTELLGKKVRCPHCNQVVTAPPTATAPGAPAAPPSPKPVATPPADTDLPIFNTTSREARESIFGEHEDESDDVFSSSDAPKRRVPDLPPPLPPAELPKSTPTRTMADVANEPTVEMKSPAALAAPSLPPRAPAPTPPAAPVVVPIPVSPIGATPPSLSGANPWAGMDDPLAPGPDSPFSGVQVEPDQRLKRKNRNQDAEDVSRPQSRPRPAAVAGLGSLFKIGFFVLAPYALLTTVLAIYGLFFKSAAPAGHPLATLPDTFGEYPPAERKKTSKLAFPVDGELPPELRVALGGKLPIGQIEIEPLGVEQRTLKIVTKGQSEKHVEPSLAPAVVLRMKIRNTSDDLLIYPLDPAFNRRVIGSEHIGTGLTVGKQTWWGGAIAWPFPSRVARIYEEAQEADAAPLKPGESREYVVFTNAAQQVIRAVKDAKDAMLWRVQVRRGRITFEGRDVPVTAIIGVEFKPSDVKEAE